ncbi:MAG: D-2-hydroxyacid dehydrogenase [Bacteroidaceae bacterium]|nr:D-2-hydroxyacid dehydrogenase [Bacteroidaceae bacterium]
MTIVILDGYALNPGDLSYDRLQQFGTLKVYDRTTPEQVIERAKDAYALLINKVLLGEKEFSQLPHLRYVGVQATGYNVVDVEAARRYGITVTNIPAYSTDSVAQMVMAHLLGITQNVGYYAQQNRAGRWGANPDFCYWDTPLIELASKQMGIIGLGRTGSAVARLAQAFGMRVAAYTSKPQSELPEGVDKVSLDELFSTSDVVSLHCPLVPATQGLVNAERLAMMKPTAILINTARGPVVDEQALADALNRGVIYAAGIDVLCEEPPRGDSPLLKARNCFVTPHIAWATIEARTRLLDICEANLRAFCEGHPQNVVS